MQLMLANMEAASIQSTVEAIGTARITRGASAAPTEKTVTGPTTGSRSFTTQTSTKPNSVPRILSPTRTKSASIKSSAPSPTTLPSCQWNLLKTMRWTWTSTCFTSRLCGARTGRTTTTASCACTPTTGRTTAGSPPSSRTPARCAQTGRPTTSSHHMRRAVLISTSVSTLTAGRSRSTTPTS